VKASRLVLQPQNASLHDSKRSSVSVDETETFFSINVRYLDGYACEQQMH